MSRRDRSNIFIFFVVLVMIGVAAYFFRSEQGQNQNDGANTTALNEETAAVGGPDEEAVESDLAKNQNSSDGEESSGGDGGYQVYSNDEEGFSLQHNSAVTQETKQEGVVTVYFDANSLSVLPADSLPLVESAFSATEEQEVMVDGHGARRISATSQKDGAALYALLLTRGTDLYYFQGTAGFLDTVEETFKFTDKKNSL